MTAALLFAASSLALGWAALRPLRTRIGAAAYHLAALPAGLLAWSVVATVHSAMSLPWSPVSMTASAAVIAAGAALGLARLSGPDGEAASKRVPLWTYLVVLAAALAVSAAATAWGRCFVTADSWANYEPMGMRLAETGRFFVRLIEERSPLVPAMQAAHRTMGGDWMLAAFPLTALWVAATVLAALLAGARAILTPLRAAATALATTALMVTSAMFFLQSFYVHSHMVTALFLTGAIAAVIMARDEDSLGWYALAGLATAGVSLARPDGLVYAFIPLVAALAIASGSARPERGTTAFLWPLATPVLATYAVALAQLGWWDGAKLDATRAFGSMAVLAVTAAALIAARRLPGSLREHVTGTGAMRLVVVLGWCLAAGLSAAGVERMAEAARSMIGNLLAFGGHGALWAAVLACVVLCVAFPEVRRGHGATGVLLFAILGFMAVAFVVHGITKPGHLGWTDSFNRIAFHAAPVAWWLLGTVATTAVAGTLKENRTA